MVQRLIVVANGQIVGDGPTADILAQLKRRAQARQPGSRSAERTSGGSESAARARTAWRRRIAARQDGSLSMEGSVMRAGRLPSRAGAGRGKWLNQSTIVLLAIVAFLGIALAWSFWAELDQVSRAPGQIIPSGRIQVIQSSDGGQITPACRSRGRQAYARARYSPSSTTLSCAPRWARPRARSPRS